MWFRRYFLHTWRLNSKVSLCLCSIVTGMRASIRLRFYASHVIIHAIIQYCITIDLIGDVYIVRSMIHMQG